MSYTRPPTSLEKNVKDMTKTSDDVMKKVSDTTESIAQAGHDAYDNVNKVAGNMKGAIDTSIKDQPMATLAIVGALGFVLGALWKS